MSQGAVSRRGSGVLLLVTIVALALLVPAVALAAGTPSVTIVGPGIVPSPTPSPTAAALAVHDAYVHLYLQDNDWGADQVRFSNDGGATWGTATTWSEYLYWSLYSDVDVSLRLDGPRTLTAQFSNDDGATWGASATAATMLDEQIPVVTAAEGYWNTHYLYRLSAHDQIGLSGVQSLWYRIDAGALTQLTQEPLGTTTPLVAKFALPGETGTAHTVDYLARDYAGNYSGRYLVSGPRVVQKLGYISGYPTSAYVVVDRTPPTVKARGWSDRWQRGPVIISLSAKDTVAGVDRAEYSITSIRAKRPAAWTSGNFAAVSQTGRHKVWFRAIDKALPKGNASAAQFVVVKIAP